MYTQKTEHFNYKLLYKSTRSIYRTFINGVWSYLNKKPACYRQVFNLENVSSMQYN